MTLLEIIRQKRNATATVATPATDNPALAPSVATVASVAVAKQKTDKAVFLTRQQEEVIRKWLTEIGEPERDHHLVLSKCKHDPEALVFFLELAAKHAQVKRREKVLKMLEDRPETQRAFLTDCESDANNVILTLGIRNAGTCELLIPRHKYDAFLLLEVLERAGIQ